MVKGELRKILRDRIFIGAFLVLFFTNLFTIYTYEKNTVEFQYIYEQKDDYLSFCNGEEGSDGNWYYSEDMDRQKEYIQNYPEFIGSMAKRADSMQKTQLYSNPASFVYRNLDKSCQDFAGLLGIRLENGNCFGIRAYARYSAGCFFVLVLAAICVYLMVYREREQGLLLLVKGTKRGHVPLAAAKLAVLLSITGVYCILQELSGSFLYGYLYGYGNLSRYLQSVSDFRNCPWKLTVWQAMLAQAGIRLLVTAAAAAFLYAVSMLLKYVVAGLAAAGLAFCAEYLLAALVPVTGAFNYLKCMNPFFCWDMGNTFGVYCNLNLFGMPAGKGGCAAAAASALFFAASCGGILAFVRTYQVTSEGWLAHFCNALRKRCACLTRHASILFYEWYKVFVQQKKWVVFAALLIWGIHESYAAAQPEILTNMPEIAYYNYMLQLSGKVTDEKLEWIEKEGERLDSLQARCIKLMGEPGGGDSVELMALRSEYESLYQGYQYLESQVEGLKGRPGSIYGKYLMDERAYIRQWTGIRQDLAVWFAGAAIALLFISGIYTVDRKYGMDKLLSTTLHGQKRLDTVRRRCSAILSFAIAVILELPLFLRYWKIDRFSTGAQRMADVTGLAASSGLTVAGFVGLVFAGKLLLSLAVCLVWIFLVKKVGNGTVAVLLGIGVAGLTAALFYYFRVDLCTLLLRRL